MIEQHITCLGPSGPHRLAYADWPGPPGSRTVLCLHGLTRNGRDFDPLAQALSARCRVICPDMPGRGRSDWLSDPAQYNFPLYLADVAALLAQLGIDEVDWVGTSMGGIMGMLLAALPANPIRRLVVNDVGAVVAREGLARIAGYVGADPRFADVAALEAVLRRVAGSFGPLSDAEWQHLAQHSARRRPDGSLGFAYDPRIGDGMRQGPVEDIDLWAQWDAICCPVLLLRGAESDLLRHDDAVAMTRRGPPTRLVELPGIGHAPALMAADQIAAIQDFLGA